MPPAGFDAVTASPEAAARYGVPPRPDAKSRPRAFEKWSRAMAGFQNRAVTVLKPTSIANGPRNASGPFSKLRANAVSGYSSNWSGTSVVNGAFSTSEAIIGTFTVPTAHQAFGTCTGGWVYSSQWPGIDGNGSADVLQAGTEVDAYCNAGQTAAYYTAWVEWYPYYEVQVSAPVITPGDELFVEVWSTSPTTGYAYFYNYSTLESALYYLTPPSGYSLQANSVEWIVERPGVNGGLAQLTNYIDSAWSYGVAWDYADPSPVYYSSGADPAYGTLELLTMIDDASNPISSAAVENSDFLWFTDYGSAY